MFAPAAPALPLKDIHLPPAPGIWPLAPGWWLVLVLASVLAAVTVRWVWQHYQRRAYRRQLESLLDQELMNSNDPASRLASLSQLLRRAARAASGAAASQLLGEQWLQFLDGADPGKPFTQGPGRLLLTGPFATHAASASEINAVEAIARRRFMQLALIGRDRHQRKATDNGTAVGLEHTDD
ncbi:MAG: DUF4381 domain-containing protein [Xanthomonadaceae bacterium]|nr:DUF4381 domain-containing protein [Xanthomonadaceae bacterium]MDP2185786.1 DUF4381 domain-containing protein [Xanthomonadales bacterium]MDZ4114663.1 DUF4381 domain-containing protein [Xanthomonadaceae bacterium]MDZ4376693.1 DUF4381 domain-containing protein [Xanthomonadaceae bacterium]